VIEVNNKLPASRKEAKEIGSKEYFTGRVCPHGHTAIRRTDSGACTACQAVSKKERYDAGWRQKANPETAKKKHRKWVEKHPKEHWIIRALGRARKRANVTNIPFDITVEYIESIFPEFCPVFGTRFNFLGNKTSRPDSPSLDKIDASKGYVVGNVAIISMKANVIKQNATSEEIFKVANWLKTKGY
jgi:hypothetical protein